MFRSEPLVRCRALGLLAALAAVVVLAAVALAGRQTVRPESVSLYLTVEQGDKLVRGLTAESFRLQEEGVTRDFHLEKPETPISIALLVEYSERSYIYFDDILYAMQGFGQAASAGNRYALVTYSYGMELRVDFTTQVGEVTAAFSALGMPAWDETDAYDSVYEMLDRLGRLPGRRVLILIGSGGTALVNALSTLCKRKSRART
jgi:hypothetical protein